MTQAPKQNSPWLSLASVPAPLSTTRFVLEPLSEKRAEMDFAALMSCRVRLREELQWGEWPPTDFTLTLNRIDLAEHHGEFLRGEAFAYTVLSPDRKRCIGCIYIERCVEVDGGQLAYWLIDDALDMEAFLVTEVLQWVHKDWSIARILLPLQEANSRGISLMQNYGFRPKDDIQTGPLSNHRRFLSESCGS